MKINMNYKIITILIALMLVVGFSLMTATPVLAAGPYTYTSIATAAWNVSTTWSSSNGGTTYPVAGDTVTISAYTVTVTASAACANLTVSPNATLVISGTSTVSATTITLNGTWVNDSTGLVTGTMTVGATGTYQLNINAGTIPTATWNAASTLNITGITVSTAIPLAGSAQTFGNVIINCTNLASGGIFYFGSSSIVNLTILSTGSGYYISSATPETISGNLDIEGGTYAIIKGSTARTLNVTGNFIIGGGTLDLAYPISSVTGTFNLSGNYIQTGGMVTVSTVTSGGAGAFNFTGSSTQTFSQTAGTITCSTTNANNTLTFTINSGAIVDFGTSILSNSSGTTHVLFTNSGTMNIGSIAGITTSGTTGNIQVGGTRTYNTTGNYTYEGTAAQVAGNGLPATVNNLTISNTAGVTLSQPTTISGTTSIGNGAILTPGANLLTSDGDFINAGTLTSGSGGVTIAGITGAQSIAGFTTTGLVSMTKTSGTATFTGNVSGAGLTINGGSSLNLGSGLTHTFTGVVTLAAGTLYGGSSTLNIVGSVSGAGGTFTPNTGTVNYNGSTGNQTAAGGTKITYNILEVNNISGVTLGAATTVTTLTIGNVTSSSIFNDGGYAITTATTLNLNSGTYNCTATTFPWGTLTANTGTVNYSLAGTQTVGALNTYNNLTLSGSGTKTLQTGTTTIGGNLTLSGTANATTVVGLTVSGALSVGDGTTFTVAGYLLTVTGTTTVGGGTSGTLSFTSATNPAKTFTGLVIINSGANWTESAAVTPTFSNGITNYGTFTASTGVHTFSNNNQALTGTFSIPSVTVTSPTVLTNNGTLTVGTALSGTGGLTQGTTGILNIGGTSGITTLNAATNAGNTVNYIGAAQTVYATNYSNLTLSGSGTKTLQSGTTAIGGNFTLSGTATTTTVTGLTIGGAVTLGSGTTFTGGSYTHYIAGNWTNNGGTFTNTGSTINFNGAAQTIAGSAGTTFNNLIFSVSGVKTIGTAASGILASGNLSIAGSGATTASVTNTNIGVNSLTLGGVDQVSGTWGSTTATSATHQNNIYFAATTGYLTVTNEITPTQLVFTAVPGTGTAGTAFSVTVQSQDANGNPSNLASATTITLSKASGGGSLSGILTGSIGIGANSVTIATPVYSKSDTMTLTATASSGVTLTAVTSGSIVFSAGLLDHFAISTITSPQTAGTAITGMTLTAQDAYNNTVTSFVSTVTYSGTAGITGTSASFSAGVLSSVSVTPMVAGSSDTFIVTGSSKTGTATFTVNPGALDHFSISTITSPQTAGTAITGMTLTAQDAYNNTVASFVSTVTYSGTAGITGTSASFSAGVLSSVSVTPMVAGSSETFIVTGSSKTGTATFNVNPGSLNAYKITAASNTPTAGATDVLTITAVDQYGNTVTSVTSESLTFSGLSNAPAGSVPTITNSSSVATNLGSGTAITFTSGVSNAGGTLVAYDAQGPVTLAATDGTHSTSSTGGAGVSLTVSPASLDHFIFTLATPQTDGVAFTNTNTLTAQDAYNNTISTFNASTNNVTISTTLSGAISGLSGTNKLTSASDFSSGIANLANHNLKYTGTTGSGTFTATSATGSKTGTSNSVTISIGGLDHFVISAISSPQTVGTPITGITLTAQDAGNNTVTSFTTTVTYSGTAGITGTSASFLSGQLTGVSVTPAVAGSSETFIVTGSSKTGTATFNVNPEVFTLTVPVFTTWSPSNGSVLRVGINTSSSTPGSVVASATGWTLTVTASNSDKMKTSGGSPVSLTNPMTFSVDGATYGSSSVYQTALLAEPASGSYVAYQAAGMFNIPLYVKQTVVSTDTAGSYSITLTYIVAPGY
jgi:hypothetical protein